MSWAHFVSTLRLSELAGLFCWHLLPAHCREESMRAVVVGHVGAQKIGSHLLPVKLPITCALCLETSFGLLRLFSVKGFVPPAVLCSRSLEELVVGGHQKGPHVSLCAQFRPFC